MPRLPVMRISLRLVLPSVAALAIGSCGGGLSGSDDGDNSALKYRGAERAAAQTIEEFATAIRGDDWKRICNDLFSPDQRELTAGIVSGSCEKEIDSYSDLDNLRLTVTSVALDNDRALANRDWARLCGLFTADRRAFGADDCEAEAREQYGEGALGLSISSVMVKHEASVGVRTGKGGGAHFTLVPDGDRWRIDSYGGTFGNG